MDGHGYPFGIDGHTLPLVVRIVQVADAFDAMTSDRPYQPALPTTIAVEEIERCSGSQFDPEVAEALTRIFYRRDQLRPPPIPQPQPEDEESDQAPDPFGGVTRPTVVRFRDPSS
jgi:HD-GYP domain-containing protein (c-di-GMP phosphodiesterase class II)